MPASSLASRIAPSSSVSSCSKKPQGNVHNPFADQLLVYIIIIYPSNIGNTPTTTFGLS